jgi:hypothetical protein
VLAVSGARVVVVSSVVLGGVEVVVEVDGDVFSSSPHPAVTARAKTTTAAILLVLISVPPLGRPPGAHGVERPG